MLSGAEVPCTICRVTVHYTCTHEKNLILQYRDQVLLMSACIHTNIECLDYDLLEG